MKAYIKLLNLNDAIVEEYDKDSIKRSTVYFKLDHVDSFYIVAETNEDGVEDKYIYANVSGIEYPFIYDDYLNEILVDRFTHEEGATNFDNLELEA